MRPVPLDPRGCASAQAGGRLVFLHSTPFVYPHFPDVGDPSRELQRPYFGMHRFQWTPEDGIEFQLTYGGWIDVLRGAGFEIERLVELQAPAERRRHEYYADWDPEWSRQWPSEEIWVARKTS